MFCERIFRWNVGKISNKRVAPLLKSTAGNNARFMSQLVIKEGSKKEFQVFNKLFPTLNCEKYEKQKKGREGGENEPE